jgi:transposase InsO family protein
MRRVLARHRLDRYRNRAKPAKHHKPRELAASGPLQVLSWDITYLSNSRIRGGYFYLYLFVDIWSRQIVGSEVHDNQSGDLAAQLLKNICIEHDIQADQATLHADNGAPMKGATMLATMHALGIVKSFSRPRVSDDNPFVESLFRHLKYAPSYPSHGFESLEAAKAWVARFVDWYNNQHLHSGIGYVTPAQRHEGLDVAVLEHRCRVYADARQRNPRRGTRRTRLWDRTEVVFLNPDRIVHTRVTSDSVAKNSARLGSGMG